MKHIQLTRRKLITATTSSSLIAGGCMASHQAFGQSIYNPNVTQLVQFSRGELPILIVAPHGGTELVTGISVRRNVNRPVPNFSFYGAVWTRELCLQIQRTLKQLSGGKSPYIVLCLAHRRYVDVNREESDAYEVPLNAPRLYWEYHDTLNEYVNRMNILYNNPILIEITGQNDFADSIVRRTLNGKTMERLVKSYGEQEYYNRLISYKNNYTQSIRNGDKEVILKQKRQEVGDYIRSKEEKIEEFGSEVYNGQDSIIGNLRKRGYRINPDLGEIDTEQALTIAGNYTLDQYGVRGISNINAIQFVIGSQYRKTANYLQTGRDFGNAIWDFAQKYLSNDIPKEESDF